MTPEQKRLIRETWERVGAIGDAAAALFYERLFEIDPTAKALFAGADMTTQRGKLLQALALRDGLRQAYRFLVSGCSLRGLRLAGHRQPCC